MIDEDSANWLRIPEAARAMNVSESTVWRWLHREKLEGIKVGRVVRIDPDSIEKMARAHQYADVRLAERRTLLLHLLRRRR